MKFPTLPMRVHRFAVASAQCFCFRRWRPMKSGSHGSRCARSQRALFNMTIPISLQSYWKSRLIECVAHKLIPKGGTARWRIMVIGTGVLLGLDLTAIPSAALDLSAAGPVVQDFFLAPLKTLPVTVCPIDDPCPPPGGTNRVDFSATNIELTQAVQCIDPTEGDHYDTNTGCTEDNQVPLVIEKPLLIRVYVRKESGEVPFGFRNASVDLFLRLTRPATGQTIFSVVRTTTVFARVDPRREELSHTANFLFRCSATICASGDVLAVRATVRPVPGVRAVDPVMSNNTFPTSGFLEQPLFATRPLHIEYYQVKLPDGRVPEAEKLKDQHLYLQDAFPVPRAIYRRGPAASAIIPFNDVTFDPKTLLISNPEALIYGLNGTASPWGAAASPEGRW
jgi:hypothetical protein